jgi:hypothetical protein
MRLLLDPRKLIYYEIGVQNNVMQMLTVTDIKRISNNSAIHDCSYIRNCPLVHTSTVGILKFIYYDYNIYRNSGKGLGPKHLPDFLYRNSVRGLTETLISIATRYQPCEHSLIARLVFPSFYNTQPQQTVIVIYVTSVENDPLLYER